MRGRYSYACKALFVLTPCNHFALFVVLDEWTDRDPILPVHPVVTLLSTEPERLISYPIGYLSGIFLSVQATEKISKDGYLLSIPGALGWLPPTTPYSYTCTHARARTHTHT